MFAASDRPRTLPRPRGGRGRSIRGAPLGLSAAVLSAAVLVATTGAAPLAGQSAGALAQACIADSPQADLTCPPGAAAAHAFQAGIGLLLGAGGPFPASPNTAGQRLQGSPRFIFDLGYASASLTYPDLSRTQIQERRTVVGAPRLTVGTGVFEGFSPAATVGGVGALDLLAELRYLPVSPPEFLSGNGLAWGLGARVGVLRESFSLPGVTLSAVHRRAPRMDFGLSRGESGSTQGVGFSGAGVEPRVTSLRAVVGKDLLAFGVSGGVQRDRVRGTAEARGFSGGSPPLAVGSAPLPVDRTTWFVGVNRTWVVSQFALELGWSPAPEGVEELGLADYQGPGGGFSGALTFRVTY